MENAQFCRKVAASISKARRKHPIAASDLNEIRRKLKSGHCSDAAVIGLQAIDRAKDVKLARMMNADPAWQAMLRRRRRARA